MLLHPAVISDAKYTLHFDKKLSSPRAQSSGLKARARAKSQGDTAVNSAEQKKKGGATRSLRVREHSIRDPKFDETVGWRRTQAV